MSPLVALAVSAGIAALAWRLHALRPSGAVAATIIGTLILSNTGWSGCAVVGIFFVGSTLVSRLAGQARRSTLADDEIRDWIQVVANGGAAAVGSLAERVEPGLGLWLVTSTLAAAAADTWATAFGSLSPRPPRDILRGKPVPPGTSGGVTWFGTIGALMGAALVALTGAAGGGRLPLYAAATAIGFLGMVVDSALGSLVQGRFWCPACGQETERRRHQCGTRTARKGGWSWLDNHGVNLATTALAGLGALLAWARMAR
jgi:uncharacterized protein (TIGR00297 family)